jgi:hypothetical protein
LQERSRVAHVCAEGRGSACRQAGALITGAEEAIADLQALIEAQATAA